MPTDCTPNFFEFAPVEGRKVVAAFDAGPVTSDAGASLLGSTDRAIGMMKRFACCFDDSRRPDLIEHEVVILRTASAGRQAAARERGCGSRFG